jgi:hypothetical protein
MINFFLALLVKYTTMTEKEGKAIAEQLNHSIQPARFDEAMRFIEKVVADLEED